MASGQKLNAKEKALLDFYYDNDYESRISDLELKVVALEIAVAKLELQVAALEVAVNELIAEIVRLDAKLDRLNEISTKTENYTIVVADHSIVIDASANAVTIKMPADPAKGQPFNVACSNSDNAATIDFNGKTFYGSSSERLFKGENLDVQYDGIQWVGH